MAKKILPQLATSLLFFTFGFLTALLVKTSLPTLSFQNPLRPLIQQAPVERSPLKIASDNTTSSPLSPQSEISSSTTVPLKKITGKYTIIAKTRLVADQPRVETGEQVNFNITLKNEGTKKKFLTHICFNHSGGETFGCLLNKNLYPNESFNLNNGMIFTSPGRYTVSVSLSQDGVNFFPPVNSNTVSVFVE